MNLLVHGGMKYQKMLRLVVINTEFIKCVFKSILVGKHSRLKECWFEIKKKAVD